MNIYEILAFSSFALSLIKKIRRNEALFFVFIFILIIVASFRGLSVATDTENYYNYFLYGPGYHGMASTEFIFEFWTNIFRKNFGYDAFMLFTYFIIILFVGLVIRNRSPLFFFSLFLYIACGFYTESFNTMRQALATAIMFYALNSLEKDDNIFKYIVWLIFAFFIHSASLICVLLLFLKNIRINWRVSSIIVIISFIVGFFMSSMLKDYYKIIGEVLGSIDGGLGRFDVYLNFDSGDEKRNLLSNLGVNIMFLFTLFFANDKIRQSYFFKAYFISIIIFNAVGSMYYLTRLSGYFSIAQIVVIPIVMKELKGKFNRFSYYTLVCAYCFSVLYLKTINPFILPYVMRTNIHL